MMSKLTRESVSLLKQILRKHRSLPAQAREMGDAYVRHEWRQLRDHGKTTSEHVEAFTAEWRNYLTMLNGSSEQEKLGRDLSPEERAALNPEQLGQLETLQKAAGDITKTSPHP